MPDKRLCAVVVLYHPSDEVYDAIASYANAVACLYVVDNSEQSIFSIQKLKTKVYSKVVLLSSGKNLGMATALDKALHQAENEGYAWLLTMDQDGSFEPAELEKIVNCVNKGDNEKVLLKAPLHTAITDSEREPCHLHKVDITMSSGNFVHVKNACKVGGYNEALFIDEVDHEFCLRGQALGYDTLVFSSFFVNHTLGQFKEVGGKTYRLYPPSRLYYMLRNYLYLKERYASEHPVLFKERTMFLKSFFLRHLRYSSHRFSCLGMLLRGYCDYKRHRFGALNEKG